ncbi:MAG: valine--tRNA ligase [Myxococcota bacterium]
MTDRELPPAYEPKDAETRWYRAWEEAGVFEPAESGTGAFTIVIPPPNVTGSLHMGHALNNTLQDVQIRYHRMNGRRTLWQPGTDHAGIATQMVVERELAKDGVKRAELGRESFIEAVWQWKERSGNTIQGQLRRLGASLAWKRDRFTMDEGLSAAVRKVFVTWYRDGLIYRDKRLVNWDPKFQTAISDLEVEQKEVKGHMWHFKYPLEDDPSRHIIVATTRPETMLGDTAVAVHPDDERYKELVGKNVVLPLVGRKIPIVADEYSDPEKGTGAVKITPAHDFNDFEVGKRAGVEAINIFDEHACLNDTVPEAYRGLDRFEARKRIVADIEALGLLDKIEDHTLQVPYGDRSGVVIEPYLTDQWFVAAEKLAPAALDAVRSGKTEFVPKHWEKTYFEWLENIEPWCISRQLWWGHSIPAWYGPDGEIFVAESEDDVRRQAHEHYGKDTELQQDPDVLDTWFSSQLWPFSTLGWPEKTPELEAFYPTQVLSTAFDIIFFWVARMMMAGIYFMGEVPFKTVYIHALVRDEQGQKMSKSKGNVVDPLEKMDQYGTDALRFTLAAMATQGRDIKLADERIAGYRNFANKLWNASRYVLMRLEDRTPKSVDAVELEPADRWILSRLATTVSAVRDAIESFRFNDAAEQSYQFVWNEYCDWSIELSKARLSGDNEASKDAACATLVHVLEQTLAMLHPLMPYITEEIWQKLPVSGERPDFLALAGYPVSNEAHRDPELEEEYAVVQALITAIRSIRTETKIGFKPPLDATVASPKMKEAIERHRSEIVALTNLGGLTLVEAVSDKPKGAAVKVHEAFELLIPLEGLVDFAKERERLTKQRTKTVGELEKLEKKLSNERFVANAPVEVVQKDRGRLEELKGMVNKIDEGLENLPEA